MIKLKLLSLFFLCTLKVWSQSYQATHKNYPSLLLQGFSLENPAALAAGGTSLTQIEAEFSHQNDLSQWDLQKTSLLKGTDWIAGGASYSFIHSSPSLYVMTAGKTGGFYSGLVNEARYSEGKWEQILTAGTQIEWLSHIKAGWAIQNIFENAGGRLNTTVELGVRPWITQRAFAPLQISAQLSSFDFSSWPLSRSRFFLQWAPGYRTRIHGAYQPYEQEFNLSLLFYTSSRDALGIHGEKNKSSFSLHHQKQPTPIKSWEPGNYTWINLNTTLSEKKPAYNFFFPQNSKPYTDVLEQLQALPRYTNCKTVFLELGQLKTSWAIASELRRHILDLKKKGIQVVAYMEQVNPLNYYLASATSSLVMPPQSLFMMPGLAVEVALYKGTLDKLGVQAQFVRHGKYKSFPEPFTRDSLSVEYSENINSLLTDIWSEILNTAQTDRMMDSNRVKAWFTQPRLSLDSAQAFGWINSTLYKEMMIEAYTGAKSRLFILPPASPAPQVWYGRPQIAVLTLEGNIYTGSQSGGLNEASGIPSENVIQILRRLRLDEQTRGLLIRINSGGGSALASDLIRNELKEFQKAGKKIAVSMGGACASGAYYISSLADTLLAEPLSLVGSIGIFGGKVVTRGLWNKIGVKKEIFKTESLADAESDYRPWNKEELQALQTYMDQFYLHFTQFVGQDRKLDSLQLTRVAEGRVFTGRQAKALGLVDDLGGLTESKNALAHLFRKNTNNFEWIEYNLSSHTSAIPMTSILSPNSVLYKVFWPNSLLPGGLVRDVLDVWAWDPTLTVLSSGGF